MSISIEKDKFFFEKEVLASLKYIAEKLGVKFNEKLEINFNWKVFANYFLCLDSIKEKKQRCAKVYLKNSINNLSERITNKHNPTKIDILVLNSSNLSSETGKILKKIYDKPDNDINDDGVYAFGPFLGDEKEEIEKINQSLNTIKNISPYFHNFVTLLIKKIILVGLTDRGGIQSGSTLKTLGCIIISPNTKETASTINQYIEDMIHEASHCKLFLEQAKDQLVNNRAEDLYPSPLRKDKRPMFGIYHANYVLGNIFSYFSQAEKIAQNQHSNSNAMFAKRAFTRYLETSSIIEKHGDLTQRGYKLFKQMKNQVDQCLK